MTGGLIFTEEDWPHGLRCLDCSAKFEDGSPYSKRLVGITASDNPITEIVCVPCGLGLAAAGAGEQ